MHRIISVLRLVYMTRQEENQSQVVSSNYFGYGRRLLKEDHM